MTPGDWYGKGIPPEEGERYEFEDFVGARFVGTFKRFLCLSAPAGGGVSLMAEHGEDVVLRLEFYDCDPFETNLPVRFRDVKED